MEVDPKISVIVPVYNGLPFIQKTLQSVLAQEYPAHEIIVINDGSKDATQEVLDSFKGRLITKTIPNGGVANARNEGIRMATGDYLAFLDSDDLWFKNKLKVVAGYIRKYPDVGFFAADYTERLAAFGNCLRVHSLMVRRHERINFNTPYKGHPFRLLLEHHIGYSPSSVVVKKSVAQEAGLFDVKCKLCEDLNFYLRVAKVTDFLLIDEILSYKRNHDENMSFNLTRLFTAHRKEVADFYAANRDFVDRGCFKPYFQDALAYFSYMAGNMHYEAGDRKKAFALYGEALAHRPSPKNFLRYLLTVAKKSVRTWTFGVTSRKSLERS